MRVLACIATLSLLPLLSEGRTETELLRSRAAEQERQIIALEKEIEQLREQIAFERRRARNTNVAPTTTVTETSAPSKTTTPPATNKIPLKYTVKGGDTISAIARRYNTSSKKLMKLNEITDPTRLRVGQVLQIPGHHNESVATAKKPAEAKPSPEKPAPAPTKKTSHTYSVKSGDNLSKVARLHGMTYTEITQLNPGLQPNHLLVGQILQVANKPMQSPPLSSDTRNTHTVATNETTPAPASRNTQSTPNPAPKKSFSSVTISDEISFGAFAAKYGTTPDRLNALNGLTLKPNIVLAKGSELYVTTN